MSTPKLRVVGWSTGTVGRHVIAGIEAHRDLEPVGLWVSNPEKDGRDAGELAGLGRELGVRATTDRDALLAMQPDAIVHTAMTDDRMFEAIEDLTAFVAAGVNVVSSGPVILQYPYGVLWEEALTGLERATASGGASLHVNGIDPGRLDLTLDEPLEEVIDRRPAEMDTKTVSLDIPAGTMGAVRFQVVGKVDGTPRVVLEHVTRTAEDQVPEWPTPPEGGGCYRVEVTGEPTMKLDFTHHGEHGDHNDSGMITTAMRWSTPSRRRPRRARRGRRHLRPQTPTSCRPSPTSRSRSGST